MPVRTPSTKAEIEKPEYSKFVKRPTRNPIARDIMPIDKTASSLNPILTTMLGNQVISYKIWVWGKVLSHTQLTADVPLNMHSGLCEKSLKEGLIKQF